MSAAQDALERSGEIASQCRATASHPISWQLEVDAGNGMLGDLLTDAAITIELLAAEMRSLHSGKSIVLPVDKTHAEAMNLVSGVALRSGFE